MTTFQVPRRDARHKQVPREPRRDWAWGPLTGHRLTVVASMVIGVCLLYGIQNALWDHDVPPRTDLERVWGWGTFLWLGAVLPGACGVIGLLAYRHPEHLDEARPIDRLVSFRIVSRGENANALGQTIRRCRSEMERTPMFPYIIEVVTDKRPSSIGSPDSHLIFIDVPSNYQTPKRSMFKARALEYALRTSRLPDDAWIVHLDEETQPTSSGIKGIAAMIAEEEASGRLRIGQGAILYHRDWKRHPFLTLADNVRTGDDFARFHFQHRIGITIFGLHGSYIVTRNDVERSIGFDFGPKGSITEDAFWALCAMQDGHRCRWVEGYLEEQSTQSVRDFIKQRKRWFQGLVKVSLYAPVKLRWRVCLGSNTLLWAIAPFATLYTVAHLFYGSASDPWVRALANLSYASFNTLYIVGLVANMREHGINRFRKKLRWIATQVILLPVFNAMEGIGVMLSFFTRAGGFHVVKK